MFACCHLYFRLQLLLTIIHITCISLSLRRTSAPIHLTSVLGVLGTQETSCIVIAGLLERDIFDLYLPEFDKPWVIHLRETCCCSTNLCSWRPNTVYRNRSVRRHQAIFWRRCRGGKVKGIHILRLLSYFLALLPVCECSKLFPLDSAIKIQKVSCVPNTPNTLVRCIGALVRRRDSERQAIWMNMNGNSNLNKIWQQVNMKQNGK